MFKKLVIGLTILCGSVVFAQNQQRQQQQIFDTQKEIQCGNKKFVLDILSKEYGEIPVFLGQDEEDSKIAYGLTLNKETGSWTMIQFDDKLMCILASGTNPAFHDAFSQHRNRL